MLVDLFPDPDEVAVGAGHQAVEHFDDVETRAERRVDRSHLEADDAAADHEHPLRHRREVERPRRIEHARIIRNERQPHDLRTGGDDRLLEAHDRLGAGLRLRRPCGDLDLDMVRIEELADAADDLDLACLGHAGKPAGQLADDLVLPAAQPGEVDPRRIERDPVLGERLRLVHHGRDVQQRLRRNAADVEAHAAQRAVALDQHGLHAEVRGAKRGAVAARTGAENEHPAFDVDLPGVGRGTRNRAGRACRRWWRRGGCRRWHRRRCRCRRLRRAGGTGFELHDDRALAHLVAQLDPDFPDRAADGRGHVHRRLVGFERDERILRLHHVAGLDEDLDDRDVLEVADIGNLDEMALMGAPTLAAVATALPPRGAIRAWDGPAALIASPAHVGEQCREIGGEARRRGAVDHAVVVGEGQRHHQARRERLAVPYRFGHAFRHAEDRDFGRVDDRRERRAADAAEARDREAAALHLGRTELALARLRRQRAPSPRRSRARLSGRRS